MLAMKRGVLYILVIFLLVSCTGLVKDSYKPLALSKVTAEQIARTTKQLHAQGLISDEVVAKIKKVYEDARLANDFVINAAIMAIDAGIRPEDSPDYVAALETYNRLLGELLNLALQYSIIKEEELK